MTETPRNIETFKNSTAAVLRTIAGRKDLNVTFAAGEPPIDGADKDHLVQAIQKRGHKAAQILTGPNDLADEISEIAQAGDIVICLGAGDITKWAYALPAQLEKIYTSRAKQSA